MSVSQPAQKINSRSTIIAIYHTRYVRLSNQSINKNFIDLSPALHKYMQVSVRTTIKQVQPKTQEANLQQFILPITGRFNLPILFSICYLSDSSHVQYGAVKAPTSTSTRLNISRTIATWKDVASIILLLPQTAPAPYLYTPVQRHHVILRRRKE